MAAPGKSSRWGSFLSQAVAGVESRLDNILAEAEEGKTSDLAAGAATAKSAAASPAPSPSPSPGPPPGGLQPPPVKPSPGNSRSSSSNRMNDRLQARLAKAVAAKNTQGSGDPKSTASPRSSIDNATQDHVEQPFAAEPESEPIAENETVNSQQSLEVQRTTASATNNRRSTDGDDAGGSEPLEQSLSTTNGTVEETSEPPNAAPESNDPTPSHGTDPPPTLASQRANIKDLAIDIEEIKAKQQEEIQEHIEQIDSLQEKLQYLSRNAADAAKKTAASAPSGSTERKMAEKDERIALLMEEGQKLSNTEQKFRATIKKLRQQIAEHDKQVDELNKGKEKALSEAESLRTKLKGNEEQEKRQGEIRKATAALQKELDTLRKDKTRQAEAAQKLEQDMKAKAEQAEGAHTEAMKKTLAAEREKQKTLEDINASLRAEKEALSIKASQETVEWQEKLDRAVERGRATEAELKLELTDTNDKLEAMRAAAEEATSGSGNEAQLKLLRQIETLQTQYATASENWQGIETSLLAKSNNLERERDEAQRRESEMRKKARDSAGRCRTVEDELQDIRASHAAAQHELENSNNQLAALRSSSKVTEEALAQAKADLEKEQRLSSRGFQADIEEQQQQRQWAEEVAGATSKGASGPDSPLNSPLISVSRTFSSDLLGSAGRSRRMVTPGSQSDSPADGQSIGRRLHSQPPLRSAQGSTAGSPVPPPQPFSPFEPPSELPRDVSPPAADPANSVADTRPSSPRNVAQDMISVSTVAAGPSVQVMERMSAAIRRLEAEKVTAKEEMARVCSQRDEARGDMVSLMKELEEAKAGSAKLPQLEEEVSSLNARYQTTLEMLGEKSELVEELKADVVDVKAMYRELVERTVT